jgi:hypothetical protein
MIVHHKDSILDGRIEDLKKEISSRDYQIIKAVRTGVDIDVLYPGHRAWYQQKMEALAELEEIKNIQDKAEDQLAGAGRG